MNPIKLWQKERFGMFVNWANRLYFHLMLHGLAGKVK